MEYGVFQKDSDGDCDIPNGTGKLMTACTLSTETNFVFFIKMGDPCCTWTKGGAMPDFTTGPGHPGDASTTNAAIGQVTCGAALTPGTGGTSPSPGAGGKLLKDDDEDDSSETAPHATASTLLPPTILSIGLVLALLV